MHQIILPAFNNEFTPIGVTLLVLMVIQLGVLIAFIRQRSQRDKRLDKIMTELETQFIKDNITKIESKTN